MKRSLPFLLVLFSVSAVIAQTPTPTPTPEDVVRISTNLIQIDVSVTNKKGEPIKDLRRDEIEIYENGKRQNLSNFSFVSNIRTETVTAPTKNTVILPGGEPRPEKIRRTIALVVDDLTLSFASSYFAKDAVLKFVREQVQEGDLVAIIRTGAGVGALQQFTTDRRQLLAAAEKIKFNLSGAGKINVFNPISGSIAEQMESERAEGERQFQRENQEFRENIFATGTLGALNYVIRGMSELPGRKSVILLSDGMRIFDRDKNGRPSESRTRDLVRRLVEYANRSSVVFYTIDTRGLEYPGLMAQDDTLYLDDNQVSQRLEERRNELFDTQEGLSFIARETGGLAILNTNGISKGIGRALNDQSYYLVGYEPADDTFDPKTRRYNKLDVKVSRPGANVRFRSGFFGIADEAMKRTTATPAQKMLNALTSPFEANEVSLRLNAMYGADSKRDTYVRGFLHIDAGELSFKPAANGSYATTFELAAYSFGDGGVVVDQTQKRYTMTVPEAEFKRISKEGFVYQFSFPVKKPGGYQVRVALIDIDTMKVGSANQFLEVPNLKKDRVVISGVVVEAMSAVQWAKVLANVAAYEEVKKETDPLIATTLRQFKSGTVLRWAATAYNATRVKKPLVRYVKLYRDGRSVYESSPAALTSAEVDAEGNATIRGVLQLGSTLPPGDYIMQLVVAVEGETDQRRSATQFLQFEIVD